MQIDPSKLSPQLKRLLLLPRHDQRSDAWHAQRDAMDITGSDAGCVLDNTIYKSPFKSRKQLFKEKTKQIGRSGGGAAAAHGTYYEDEALEKYCEARGETALTFGLVPHPTIGWIGASPDAVTLSNRLVEIKVLFSST